MTIKLCTTRFVTFYAVSIARIRDGPALRQPLPERPNGMHTETYEHITYQILAYELAAAQELKKYRDERWLPVLLKMDELAAQQ